MWSILQNTFNEMTTSGINTDRSPSNALMSACNSERWFVKPFPREFRPPGRSRKTCMHTSISPTSDTERTCTCFSRTFASKKGILCAWLAVGRSDTLNQQSSNRQLSSYPRQLPDLQKNRRRSRIYSLTDAPAVPFDLSSVIFYVLARVVVIWDPILPGQRLTSRVSQCSTSNLFHTSMRDYLQQYSRSMRRLGKRKRSHHSIGMGKIRTADGLSHIAKLIERRIYMCWRIFKSLTASQMTRQSCWWVKFQIPNHTAKGFTDAPTSFPRPHHPFPNSLLNSFTL